VWYDRVPVGKYDKSLNREDATVGAPGKNEEQAQFIGAKVDYLFRTITKPNGKPYTYQEVAARTGLNFSYLRKLRVGKVASPSRKVLERLTTFFGITPDYWFRSDNMLPPDIEERHQLGLLLQKIEQAQLSPEQLRQLDEIVTAMTEGSWEGIEHQLQQGDQHE
jgi:transcriptional regulator with XRE-family HTH domain